MSVNRLTYPNSGLSSSPCGTSVIGITRFKSYFCFQSKKIDCFLLTVFHLVAFFCKKFMEVVVVAS